MLCSFLLFLGNIGGTEVLLLLVLFSLSLIFVIRRLFRSKPTVIINQSQPTSSVADELRKLQHLREQGVLTTQEFDKQKARLLH